MNNTKKNRLPLYIGIPVILLLIFLRFGLYFLKSDGFSGLSMLLPILLLLFILFALCTAAFFAAWVYQDCKKRGDDPVLWAIVVFIATPFIGLLIYFLRRSEIKAKCPACGHRISVKAKYCEECGAHIENKEDNGVMVKQDLEELGMTVNFKPIEFNTLVSKLVNTNDFDSVIMGFTGSPLEPYGGKNVWYSNGTLHVFNMRKTPQENKDIYPWEQQINELFDKASLELDFDKRKKLYEQYQQVVYDQKPLIYLYSPIIITAIRKKFGNINPTALGGVVHNLEEVYIK